MAPAEHRGMLVAVDVLLIVVGQLTAWTAVAYICLGDAPKAEESGFHPDLPEFGFGEATSTKFIQDVIGCTKSCGAVRHGAECFNFWFPQELDQRFLVVWEGFQGTPWRYLKPAERAKLQSEECAQRDREQSGRALLRARAHAVRRRRTGGASPGGTTRPSRAGRLLRARL